MWHQNNVHQGLLETQIYNIFPHFNTIVNVRKDATIKNPQTGQYLEVDVWLPDINLCFEFQDDYHFRPAWYSHVPLSLITQKDNTKRYELLNTFQTLIAVPYWWDGTQASLQGTIHFHRPDLKFSETSVEIPANPILRSHQKQLMLASFPGSGIEVTLVSWWVGEKWDGVRCFWNAPEKQLYSRRNIEIDLSPTINSVFGNTMLDGELWCGRGFYHETQNFSASSWDKLNDSFLRMLCFDEASVHMHDQPFEERYSLVLSCLSPEHPVVAVAPRFFCENEHTILAALEVIIKGGGEGLILRKPLSVYTPGRSESLLKIKGSFSDQEALVTKVEVDGSLVLQLPHGHIFSVTKKDCILPQQAVKGDIVTFSVDFSQRTQAPTLRDSIQDFTVNTPSNPVVYRIRSDLAWDDVLRNPSFPPRTFATEQFSKQIVRRFLDKRELPPLQEADKDESVDAPDNNESGSQSWKLLKERRAYFDQFAVSRGMDPLNPVFWYNVTPPEVSKYRTGYHTIVKYYGGRLSTTLMQLYPDIGLRKANFNELHLKSRRETERAYFEAYAAAKGKNPLNPSFWYTVSTRSLFKRHPAYRRIIASYGGKLSSALIKLYPNIGLQKSRFKVPISWKDFRDRRAYFDNFAASQGMDPLNPTFWYNVTPLDITSFKGGYYSITQYYGGSLYSTLVNLYPDIGLQKSFFKVTNWKNESLRREFFDKYASVKGGDPLNPLFWYTVTTADVLKYDQSYSTISSYHGGLASTLLQLYPNIGLNKSGFKYQLWTDQSDRRAFLDNFATSRGKDPLNPDFWYTVKQRELGSENGFWGVAGYHDKKISTVLMDLYPDIGLKKSGFRGPHWQLESARKAYFEKFADAKGMDSLNPLFWYSVEREDLKKFHQGIRQITRYYDGKLSSTLLHLFPDIGLSRAYLEATVKYDEKSRIAARV